MNANHTFSDPAAGDGTPRLMLGCVLGSLLLHALLLWLLPGVWRSEPATVVAVLDVQLLAPPPAPAPAVAEPAPRRDRPAVKNPAPAAPVPRRETPPAPVIALEAAQPAVAEAARVGPPPASATPAAPPAAPAAAAARTETVTPPSFSAAYLRNPPPVYPAAARRNGEEGTVTLRVLVSAEGAPSRVELERSSGSRLLDAAAIEAVRGWRFQPARRGSQVIEDWALVPLRFRLDP